MGLEFGHSLAGSPAQSLSKATVDVLDRTAETCLGKIVSKLTCVRVGRIDFLGCH